MKGANWKEGKKGDEGREREREKLVNKEEEEEVSGRGREGE